jgi:hypothetical protein
MLRRLSSIAALAMLGAAAACNDLSTSAERTPAALRLDRDTITTTAGQTAAFTVTVLDQHGAPFERVPFWAHPEYVSANPHVVRAEGQDLLAALPGQASVRVKVANLSTQALVRVNPTHLRLQVDSVTATQGAVPLPGRHVMIPGRDVALRVFVTGDQPNFFRPRVHVRVIGEGEVLQTFVIDRGRESVPEVVTGNDPASTWNVTIPGALVQPGIGLEVVADPDGVVPRAPEARDRFPASGVHRLPFGARLTMEAAYLTQSIQRLDGSVPLIAGREALLRVFALSDAHVVAHPRVRATLFHQAAEVGSFELRRETISLPTAVNELELAESWNVRIPGEFVRPGLRMVVEIDPDQLIPRLPESQVRLPAVGTLAVDVREVPPLWLRVVPVHQVAFGTTGQVNQQNLRRFAEPTVTRFPVGSWDVDLRATYSTHARLDTEAGWSQLLREIDALRVVDGSGRYYYGVHTNPPNAVWGGLGYVGWPAAIGHDGINSGPLTMAHELGHNFGLLHAPCGNPAGVDPQFPHADARIGVFGFDPVSGMVQSASGMRDLMSYCNPTWISDYNYLKVLNFRVQQDGRRSAALELSGAAAPGLLVWGGVEGGRLVLEPAFTLDMRPSLPVSSGRYRIEGYDGGGAQLFSMSFEPNATDHSDAQKGFAFSIPASLAQPERLAELRLTGPEGRVSQTRSPDLPLAPLSAERRGNRVALAWQRTAHPMALIRDAATGEVLSFARGGDAQVPTGTGAVEILLSDGVRTVRSLQR